jgi:hypothetical protein
VSSVPIAGQARALVDDPNNNRKQKQAPALGIAARPSMVSPARAENIASMSATETQKNSVGTAPGSGAQLLTEHAPRREDGSCMGQAQLVTISTGPEAAQGGTVPVVAEGATAPFPTRSGSASCTSVEGTGAASECSQEADAEAIQLVATFAAMESGIAAMESEKRASTESKQEETGSCESADTGHAKRDGLFTGADAIANASRAHLVRAAYYGRHTKSGKVGTAAQNARTEAFNESIAAALPAWALAPASEEVGFDNACKRIPGEASADGTSEVPLPELDRDREREQSIPPAEIAMGGEPNLVRSTKPQMHLAVPATNVSNLSAAACTCCSCPAGLTNVCAAEPMAGTATTLEAPPTERDLVYAEPFVATKMEPESIQSCSSESATGRPCNFLPPGVQIPTLQLPQPGMVVDISIPKNFRAPASESQIFTAKPNPFPIPKPPEGPVAVQLSTSIRRIWNIDTTSQTYCVAATCFTYHESHPGDNIVPNKQGDQSLKLVNGDREWTSQCFNPQLTISGATKEAWGPWQYMMAPAPGPNGRCMLLGKCDLTATILAEFDLHAFPFDTQMLELRIELEADPTTASLLPMRPAHPDGSANVFDVAYDSISLPDFSFIPNTPHSQGICELRMLPPSNLPEALEGAMASSQAFVCIPISRSSSYYVASGGAVLFVIDLCVCSTFVIPASASALRLAADLCLLLTTVAFKLHLSHSIVPRAPCMTQLDLFMVGTFVLLLVVLGVHVAVALVGLNFGSQLAQAADRLGWASSLLGLLFYLWWFATSCHEAMGKSDASVKAKLRRIAAQNGLGVDVKEGSDRPKGKCECLPGSGDIVSQMPRGRAPTQSRVKPTRPSRTVNSGSTSNAKRSGGKTPPVSSGAAKTRTSGAKIAGGVRGTTGAAPVGKQSITSKACAARAMV